MELNRKDKLIKIAEEILEKGHITLDTRREDCSGWDSAAHLMLLAELEDTMNISVPIEQVEKIRKLGDFLLFSLEQPEDL